MVFGPPCRVGGQVSHSGEDPPQGSPLKLSLEVSDPVVAVEIDLYSLEVLIQSAAEA